MYPHRDDSPLLDPLAELTVIAAWLAVPLFALLGEGALAPPLHVAGGATILTLALRAWRSTRRGKALAQIRERLTAYLGEPALQPLPADDPHAGIHDAGRHHRRHFHATRPRPELDFDLLRPAGPPSRHRIRRLPARRPGEAFTVPAFTIIDHPVPGVDIEPYPNT